MPTRVQVRAPATVANVGPGFDCLGFALAWHNLVTVELTEGGATEVVVTGEGAAEVPRDEANLIARAARRLLGEAAGLRVESLNAIPLGRGLGSSAAAIVAGLSAGLLLSGQDALDRDRLLALATEMEGHADNVAACVHGGFTVAGAAGALRFGDLAALRAFVCVAPRAQSTEEARKALPDALPFADAVDAVRRATLLAATVGSGDTRLLLEATDDRLHQPARFALMPESAELVAALRAEGLAAFLSGAGPSVAILAPAGRAQAVHNVVRHHAPGGWRVRPVAFDPDGAAVLESS